MVSHYQSLDASIVIVDIRNFTPNLKDSESSTSTHRLFCDFLSHFYRTCVETCTLACGSGDPRSLYINSTGDGVLAVFLSTGRHFIDAYLSGIMLFNKLPLLFEEYNRRKHRRVADVGFGIGLDSGAVWRVTSSDSTGENPAIETYIGDCINIAARVESVTKEHDRTRMIVSQHTYELLCQRLLRTDYNRLWRQATDRELTGRRKKTVWDRMNAMDERFLLRFISAYNLRGVSEPVRLYRLSPTLASPKRRECQSMLKRLTASATHLKSINDYMRMNN
jgi:class 3 adenylate cyclase